MSRRAVLGVRERARRDRARCRRARRVPTTTSSRARWRSASKSRYVDGSGPRRRPGRAPPGRSCRRRSRHRASSTGGSTPAVVMAIVQEREDPGHAVGHGLRGALGGWSMTESSSLAVKSCASRPYDPWADLGAAAISSRSSDAPRRCASRRTSPTPGPRLEHQRRVPVDDRAGERGEVLGVGLGDEHRVERRPEVEAPGLVAEAPGAAGRVGHEGDPTRRRSRRRRCRRRSIRRSSSSSPASLAMSVPTWMWTSPPRPPPPTAPTAAHVARSGRRWSIHAGSPGCGVRAAPGAIPCARRRRPALHGPQPLADHVRAPGADRGQWPGPGRVAEADHPVGGPGHMTAAAVCASCAVRRRAPTRTGCRHATPSW